MSFKVVWLQWVKSVYDTNLAGSTGDGRFGSTGDVLTISSVKYDYTPPHSTHPSPPQSAPFRPWPWRRVRLKSGFPSRFTIPDGFEFGAPDGIVEQDLLSPLIVITYQVNLRRVSSANKSRRRQRWCSAHRTSPDVGSDGVPLIGQVQTSAAMVFRSSAKSRRR